MLSPIPFSTFNNLNQQLLIEEFQITRVRFNGFVHQHANTDYGHIGNFVLSSSSEKFLGRAKKFGDSLLAESNVQEEIEKDCVFKIDLRRRQIK